MWQRGKAETQEVEAGRATASKICVVQRFFFFPNWRWKERKKNSAKDSPHDLGFASIDEFVKVLVQLN